MRIADVSEFYSEHGGGVRTYVRQKLAASARLGHECIVIAPGPADREEHLPGGKIVWVKAPVLAPDPRYHIFVGMDAALAVLDREHPDVVEGSSPWRGGWIAARWRGHALKSLFMHADPVAVYPQTLLAGTLGRDRVDRMFAWFWSYLRKLNGHFDATIVAGDWLADRFAGFGLRGLHSVPLGVERAIFRPGLRDESLRRNMLATCGLDESAALLIAVGRHHPEKRLPVIMEAAAQAGRTRPVGLYLIGDGLIRGAIERKARSLPHIHVAGQVDDRAKVAAMMASADALIHGSASETYGIAVAEALACGTPVIVPDAGGAADFAAPGCSQIYSAGDVASAAIAMLWHLAKDPAGTRDAAERYAAEHIPDAGAHFDRLFAFFEAQLARKRSASAAA
jgi:alpha-1,6-mannosyltransferase